MPAGHFYTGFTQSDPSRIGQDWIFLSVQRATIDASAWQPETSLLWPACMFYSPIGCEVVIVRLGRYLRSRRSHNPYICQHKPIT